MVPRSVRFGVRSRELSNVGQSLDGWPKIYYLELLSASKGTLSRWSRLHLLSLASTNPHWARVVGSVPFSLCVINKEGLCPSSSDINRLMMMKRMKLREHSKQGSALVFKLLLSCRPKQSFKDSCRPGTSLQRLIRARSRQSSRWIFCEKAVSFVR
jgi:hypothetical protein